MSENPAAQKTGLPTAVASLQADGPESIRHRTLLGDAVRRFRQNRLAMIGIVILVFVLILAVFADVIAPYPLNRAFFTGSGSIVNLRPFIDPAHPLGGD